MGKAYSKFACCAHNESESESIKGYIVLPKRNLSDVSLNYNSRSSTESSFERQSVLTLSSLDEYNGDIYFPDGFNLVQKCASECNVKVLREILTGAHNLNFGPCSFPLHIACVRGNLPCVELLIRYGASVNVEAPMCWPGAHSDNCRGRVFESPTFDRVLEDSNRIFPIIGRDEPLDAYQYAIAYDRDRVLKFLMSRLVCDEPVCKDKPFIEEAIERESRKCCEFLLETRIDDVETCYWRCQGSYGYRDKSAAFLHVLLLMARKPADFTSNMCRSFLRISVALARKEYHLIHLEGRARFERNFYKKTELRKRINHPWHTLEMKAVVTLLLQTAANNFSRAPKAAFLREFLYKMYDVALCFELEELLECEFKNSDDEDEDEENELNFSLLDETACLSEISEIDSFSDFDKETKERFINCLKVLSRYGNGRGRSSPQILTPLHVLVFSVSENMTLTKRESKLKNFAYIKNLMILLFKLGMDPAKLVSHDSPSVLYGVVAVCKNMGHVKDLELAYELILTLIQHGINPDEKLQCTEFLRGHYGRSNPFVSRSCCYMLELLFIIFAKKGHLLVHSKSTFSRVLQLFYFSMSHSALFECLDAVYLNEDRVPFESPSYYLIRVIEDMIFQPRSLKQIARLSIYNSLNRKPGLYANFLPLPSSLRNYVKNFEP